MDDKESFGTLFNYRIDSEVGENLLLATLFFEAGNRYIRLERLLLSLIEKRRAIWELKNNFMGSSAREALHAETFRSTYTNLSCTDWKERADNIAVHCLTSNTALFAYKHLFFASPAGKAIVRFWFPQGNVENDKLKRPGHVSIQTFCGGKDGKGIYMSLYPNGSYSLIMEKAPLFRTYDQDKLLRSSRAEPDEVIEITIGDFDIVASLYKKVTSDKNFNYHAASQLISSSNSSNCSLMVYSLLEATGSAKNLMFGIPKLNGLPGRFDSQYNQLLERVEEIQQVKLWTPTEILKLTKFIKLKEQYIESIFDLLVDKNYTEHIALIKTHSNINAFDKNENFDNLSFKSNNNENDDFLDLSSDEESDSEIKRNTCVLV